MSKTDSTEKVVTAKEATHLIYKRQTGPRAYERQEGSFIITRGRRIKIATKAEEIKGGSDPVIPLHLAKDIVEAGHGVFFASSASDKEPSETGKETDLPPIVSDAPPAPDSFPSPDVPLSATPNEELEKLTVAQLRELPEAGGLASNLTKSDLIAAIIAKRSEEPQKEG